MDVIDQKYGFTLVELLLYTGITSLFLLFVSMFLFMLLEARVKNQTIAEVDQQGMQVVHMISQTIRNAEAVISPTQGQSASSLAIDVLEAGLDPTIFDVSNGVIQIKEGTGLPVAITNARVIASGFTGLNLSRTGTPGTIRFQFILTHVNPSGRNEYIYSKTFVGSATLRQP